MDLQCAGVESPAMTSSDLSAFAVALKAGREARGRSVHDVASQLLLSEMQVRGLEADDLSVFYGPAYAQRAASAYAAWLGLEVDFLSAPPFQDVPTVDAQATPLLQSLGSGARVGPQVPRSLIAGAVLVLLVAGGLWVRHSLARVDKTAAASPVPVDTQGVAPAEAAVVEPPAAAEQALPAEPQSVAADPVAVVDQTPGQSMDIEADRGDKSLRFYLVINSTAVVNAFDGEGNRLLGGRQSPMPGQSYYGKPPFSLQTNDAEAIEVYYMGARVRPAQDANGGFSTRFAPPPRQP